MEGSEAHCHVNCVQHLCKASIGVLHLRRGSWLAWRWLATYWARKMETSSHQSEKGISQGKEVRCILVSTMCNALTEGELVGLEVVGDTLGEEVGVCVGDF